MPGHKCHPCPGLHKLFPLKLDGLPPGEYGLAIRDRNGALYSEGVVRVLAGQYARVAMAVQGRLALAENLKIRVTVPVNYREYLSNSGQSLRASLVGPDGKAIADLTGTYTIDGQSNVLGFYARLRLETGRYAVVLNPIGYCEEVDLVGSVNQTVGITCPPLAFTVVSPPPGMHIEECVAIIDCLLPRPLAVDVKPLDGWIGSVGGGSGRLPGVVVISVPGKLTVLGSYLEGNPIRGEVTVGPGWGELNLKQVNTGRQIIVRTESNGSTVYMPWEWWGTTTLDSESDAALTSIVYEPGPPGSAGCSQVTFHMSGRGAGRLQFGSSSKWRIPDVSFSLDPGESVERTMELLAR